MSEQPQTRMSVEDYFIEEGPEKLVGRSFVDSEGAVYTIKKLVHGAPRPRVVAFFLCEQAEYEHNIRCIRYDPEATPQEVQRAKEGKLAEIAVSLDPSEDPSIQNGGS